MYNQGRKKMTKTEEIKKELLASKERLETALARLNSIMEEGEEPVTLQLSFYNKTVSQANLFEVEGGSCVVKSGCTSVHRWAVKTRTEGPLAGKAFTLNEEYDWELGRDEEDALCLVPIKKKVKNKKKDIIGHFEPW
jgi:hypothetical protein